jgi:EAL domain-containing protein (putative c-di-GMP-specific phosphodiesterase class I)
MSYGEFEDIDVDRLVWDVTYRERVKSGIEGRRTLSRVRGPACWQQPDGSLSFATAFQPIVDVARRRIFAYEALVRDLNGNSIGHFFDLLEREERYQFDHLCRVQAIKDAVRLKLDVGLSLNFLPNSVGMQNCSLERTLAFARQAGFPSKRLIFEISEKEGHEDLDFFAAYIDSFAKHVRMAIDDFGQGYSGLALLAGVHPHMVKLDMALVRGIHEDEKRQAILQAIVDLGRRLDIDVIAEGVETRAEAQALLSLGVSLMQGFYFAVPAINRLPEVCFKGLAA